MAPAGHGSLPAFLGRPRATTTACLFTLTYNILRFITMSA